MSWARQLQLAAQRNLNGKSNKTRRRVHRNSSKTNTCDIFREMQNPVHCKLSFTWGVELWVRRFQKSQKERKLTSQLNKSFPNVDEVNHGVG
eukprot:728778-Amphidinium_carterae.1